MSCNICKVRFTRASDLKRHERSKKHNEHIAALINTSRHRKNNSSNSSSEEDVQDTQHADRPAWFFDGVSKKTFPSDCSIIIKTILQRSGFEIDFQSLTNCQDTRTLLTAYKTGLFTLLRNAHRIFGEAFQFSIVLQIVVTRGIFCNETDADTLVFHNASKFRFLQTPLQIMDRLNNAIHELIVSEEDKQEQEGSGYCIAYIMKGILRLVRCRPVRPGENYGNHNNIIMSKLLRSKVIVNVKQPAGLNEHSCRCLAQCILAKRFPSAFGKKKNLISRAQSYSHLYNRLDWSAITKWPADIRCIPQLERDNNLSINIYCYEEDIQSPGKKILLPLQISNRMCCYNPACKPNDEDTCVHEIDLLLLDDYVNVTDSLDKREKKKIISHFVLIKSIRKFLFGQE